MVNAKLTLTYVRFERIILILKGKVDGVDQLKSSRLYIKNAKTKEELNLQDVTFDGDSFVARINVLELCKNYPIEKGRWYVKIDLPEMEPLVAYVSDAVYDRIYLSEMDGSRTDLMIDKSPENYWHGLSKLNNKNWTYFLDVDYALPERSTNIFVMWAHGVKKRFKSRLRVIRNAGFVTIFNFFNKSISKSGNKVFFTSDRSDQLSGNEKFVYDRMIERGLGDKYKFYFDFKAGIDSYRSLFNKFSFTYHLATSDYIFLDDYQPEMYKNDYDPKVQIIQLWHACGAFKTLGFERLDKSGAPPFDTRVHKCYTLVPVSSDHSANHHAEAFAIDKSKFVPAGIARTDVFFDEDYKKSVREKVLNKYPQIKDANKVLLYAPTFRGNNARTAFFPMQMINFVKIGKYLHDSGNIMFIKMHPFVAEPVKIPAEYADCFIEATDYPDINELLQVTDVLITDYSSVIYEMALLKKPMVFYAFDLDTYDDDRGFYEPYADIVPGKIVKTLRGLISALEEEDYESEKLDGFLTKNFKYLDGHSTDRVIDLIFGNEDGNSKAEW